MCGHVKSGPVDLNENAFCAKREVHGAASRMPVFTLKSSDKIPGTFLSTR